MEPMQTGRFVMPEVVTSQFHLREGDKVADYGAGSGFFTKTIAEAIGPSGLVYAVEIQKGLVDKVGEMASQEGLGNIHPLWCDLEEANGIKITDSELDVAVLINSLFAIEDKQTAIQEMSRALRSGGKFFVIDWTESFAGLGPTQAHVVTAAAATALAEICAA